MQERPLSSDNCMTIIHGITVGSKDLNATYKNRKGRKRVMVLLGDIPDEWTDKQLDEYLKGCRVVLRDGFIEYPAGTKNDARLHPIS